jgi:hypothetical protein
MQRAVELIHGGHGRRIRHFHALRHGAQISAIRPVVYQELLEQSGMANVVVTLRRLLLWHALPGQIQVLSRDLGERLQRRELLRRRKGQIQCRAILHLRRAISRGRLRHVVGEGQLVELQQRALAVAEWKGRTFLHEVIREAVYTALGELRCSQLSLFTVRLFAWRGCTTHFFSTRLARVLVAVAGIFEFGAAFKVFEDQLIGSATHDRPKGSSGFEF